MNSIFLITFHSVSEVAGGIPHSPIYLCLNPLHSLLSILLRPPHPSLPHLLSSFLFLTPPCRNPSLPSLLSPLLPPATSLHTSNGRRSVREREDPLSHTPPPSSTHSLTSPSSLFHLKADNVFASSVMLQMPIEMAVIPPNSEMEAKMCSVLDGNFSSMTTKHKNISSYIFV